MKRILELSLKILVTGVVLVLLGFVASEQQKNTINELRIHLNNQEEYTFITQTEILEVIHAGGDVTGKSLSEIDLPALEKKVKMMPEIRDAQVYCDLNGILHVEARQRKPLVRIFSKNGDSYYIDEDGFFMPLSEYYTARVPVASGNIRMTYPVGSLFGSVGAIAASDSLSKRSVVDDIYQVAKHLSGDEFWLAQTEQIFVNDEEELELIPKLGDHTIILGDASGLDRKLKNLMAMYKSGFPAKGWDQYKSVNLKFENQVVCTKK